jgi:broad specificity phosphatase PhoE
MRIGLMRHLPVAYKYSFAKNSQDFEQEIENYNQADVIKKKKQDIGKWDICYTSSMKRAQLTASFFYQGKIIITDLLKEVPLKAVPKTRMRMPVIFWFLLVRFYWLINSRSQPEPKCKTIARARNFLETFCFPNQDHSTILLVSHGLFLLVLQKVLRQLKYRGKIFLRPNHGTLYVFEKKPYEANS